MNAMTDTAGTGAVPDADPEPAPRARYVFPGGPLEEVHRLRRDVYFQEQGRRPNFGRRVCDPLDVSGTTLLLETGGQAVASVRLHDFVPPAVRSAYGRLFGIDRFADDWPPRALATASRIAVRAEQRSRGVFDRMMTEAYVYWQVRKIRFGVVACPPALHPLLERYGFREYLPPTPRTGGVVLLRMALVMEDAAGLSACGSLLQHLVRRPELGLQARAWMEHAFPHFP